MALKDRLNEDRLAAQHSDRSSVAHWRQRQIGRAHV